MGLIEIEKKRVTLRRVVLLIEDQRVTLRRVVPKSLDSTRTLRSSKPDPDLHLSEDPTLASATDLSFTIESDPYS